MDNVAVPTKIGALTRPPHQTRRWLRRIGSLLGVTGAVFVAMKLYEYQGQIGLRNITWFEYASLAGLAVVYGASNLLLAFAWRMLLSALNSPVSIRWAVWAYAVSQLAKYVPGNIFQFAGRQAIGLAAGLPGWPLVKSTAWELTLISLSGIVFSILVFPLLFATATLISTSVFAAAATVLILIVRVLGNSKAAFAVACYLVFLALSGLIFTAALEISRHGTGTLDIASLSTLVGAYVIAWLAGLLTPGAPAGVGVREAVLLVLLAGQVTATSILLAVVLGRVITVAGDLMFYAAGSLVVFPGRDQT